MLLKDKIALDRRVDTHSLSYSYKFLDDGISPCRSVSRHIISLTQCGQDQVSSAMNVVVKHYNAAHNGETNVQDETTDQDDKSQDLISPLSCNNAESRLLIAKNLRKSLFGNSSPT